MTGLQFDTIVSKQNELEIKVNELTNKINSLITIVDVLCGKTVVISDLDEEVKQVKLDVKSLIDEKEA